LRIRNALFCTSLCEYDRENVSVLFVHKQIYAFSYSYLLCITLKEQEPCLRERLLLEAF